MQRPKSSILDLAYRYFWPEIDSADRGERLAVRLICGFSFIIGVAACLHNFSTAYLNPDMPPHVKLIAYTFVALYFVIPAVYYSTESLRIATLCMIGNLAAHSNVLIWHEVTVGWSRELFLIAGPMISSLLLSKRDSILISIATVANLFLLGKYADTVTGHSAEVVAMVGLTAGLGLWQVRSEFEKNTQELIQKRIEAQQAAEAKSEFLAKMSHEIRTPLNGMHGAAQLLSETKLTDEQHEILDIGHRSAQTLSRLINDILDYSKIDAGGVALESIPVYLPDLIDEVEIGMKTAASAKRLRISHDFSDDLPKWIIGDPTRLTQVLTNLIGNAIKFSENGSLYVLFRREGDTMRVSVSDPGIGMSPEEQSRVFNKFEQANLATTRKFGGTGLGLAICKDLIEMMGGTIGVESELGKGSTFWFNIPLFAAENQNPGKTPRNKPLRNLDDLIGKHLLIVEDNRTNQIVAERLLKTMRVTSEIADNGQVAIDMCNRTRFDVILMDIQMPVVNGIEATRHIRLSEGPNRTTPIIALSANVLPEQQQSYLQAGMTSCLGKPFNKSNLGHEILRALQNRKSQDHAA